MARTKDFAVKAARKMQKQLQTVDADLYGGANDVTLGAGDLTFTKVTITDPPEVVIDDAINGTQSGNFQETVAILPTIEAEGNVYPAGQEPELVGMFGWDALDGPKDSGDATNFVRMVLLDNQCGKDQRAYTTAESALVPSGYDPTDRINVCMKYAVDMGPSTVNAKNTKISTFEISGAQKQPLQLKYGGTCEIVSRDAAKTGTDDWDKTADTFESTYKMHQGAFEIAEVGGSFSTIGILEFSLKANFGTADDNVPTGTSNGGYSRAEPLSDGITEVTFDFKVHKHDTDQWKTWEAGQTQLSLKLAFTQGDNFMKVLIPMAQITNIDIDPTGGSSVMVNCKCFLPTEADPFTTDRTVDSVEWVLPYSTQVYMMMQGTDQTNYLRAV